MFNANNIGIFGMFTQFSEKSVILKTLNPYRVPSCSFEMLDICLINNHHKRNYSKKGRVRNSTATTNLHYHFIDARLIKAHSTDYNSIFCGPCCIEHMTRLRNTSYPCLFNHVFWFLIQGFLSSLQCQHKASHVGIF